MHLSQRCHLYVFCLSVCLSICTASNPSTLYKLTLFKPTKYSSSRCQCATIAGERTVTFKKRIFPVSCLQSPTLPTNSLFFVKFLSFKFPSLQLLQHTDFSTTIFNLRVTSFNKKMKTLYLILCKPFLK